MPDIVTFLGSLPDIPGAEQSVAGPVEVIPLSKIQSLTGRFMGRNWISIPHVTHNDQIDVTRLESLRGGWNRDNPDFKITPLLPLMKALVLALKRFPIFNSSIVDDGASVALKRYFNIGVAVDTPNGLLVAVVQDVDKKSMKELSQEVAALAEKARTKGLSYKEMSGGCMTISSLGHIGGTSFSPIINAPEVAILGVLPTSDQPRRSSDGKIDWRRLLPVSLSYDHRVINGADAARFVKFLEEALESHEIAKELGAL